MLPDGWKKIKIDTLCTLSNGHSFKPKDWSDSGLPIIRIQNLNGSRDYNYYSGIPEKTWIVYTGDLLFAWAGTKGVSFGPCIWNGEKGVLNQHIYKVVPCRNVNLNYLFLLLCVVTSEIEKRAHGFKATLLHVQKKDIIEQLVLLPPLSEQEKIAAILSTWDKAISTADALLENSRQQRKALMQQLLTGKRRLPGFKGEWKQVKLEKIAQIEKGKPLNGNNIKKGPYPVIAGGKTISAWHKDFTHENVVTVSASGAYAGFVSFHNYKIWASDCTVITNINNISYCRYLYYALLSRQDEVYKLQTGGAQPHVYPKDLASLGSIVPPLDEQRAIAAVLDAADREISLLEQKAARLREEKKALMQQLLTGKRRVRV